MEGAYRERKIGEYGGERLPKGRPLVCESTEESQKPVKKNSESGIHVRCERPHQSHQLSFASTSSHTASRATTPTSRGAEGSAGARDRKARGQHRGLVFGSGMGSADPVRAPSTFGRASAASFQKATMKETRG